MRILLDTNVISALSPHRATRTPEIAAWIGASTEDIYFSAVSASEIEAGIARAERIGAHRKAYGLRVWWDAIRDRYSGRILPIDVAVATEAGKLLDAARAHDPGYEDIAIAATARVFSLTVATANERHFLPLGVHVLNPFKDLPSV